jgi:hypothetical protein
VERPFDIASSSSTTAHLGARVQSAHVHLACDLAQPVNPLRGDVSVVVREIRAHERQRQRLAAEVPGNFVGERVVTSTYVREASP